MINKSKYVDDELRFRRPKKNQFNQGFLVERFKNSYINIQKNSQHHPMLSSTKIEPQIESDFKQHNNSRNIFPALIVN